MSLRPALFTVMLLLLPACASTTVHGKHGRSLTLLRPKNQSLARADSNKILITVDRDGFSGPIRIRFEDLPEGVRLVEDDAAVPSGDMFETFTLFTEANAAPVRDHPVRVVATGPNGLEAVERFQIDIR